MEYCIFCGSSGSLTKEHLWPNWLRKELAVSERILVRLEDEKNGEEMRDRSFSTVPFVQQVRAVCASCNGGWMSEIEADAKPLLQRTMRAEGALLSLDHQRKLAAWALLKTCVFAELSPSKNMVPKAHREYLYNHRRPPTWGVWVRLGAYEVRDLMNYAYQGLMVTGESNAEPIGPTVYFATFTVGALVVHVAGSLLPGLSFGGVPGLQPLHVTTIWPPDGNPTNLKQDYLMSHETLVGFSKLFYNVIGKLTGGAPPPR